MKGKAKSEKISKSSTDSKTSPERSSRVPGVISVAKEKTIFLCLQSLVNHNQIGTSNRGGEGVQGSSFSKQLTSGKRGTTTEKTQRKTWKMTGPHASNKKSKHCEDEPSPNVRVMRDRWAVSRKAL